ncbi:MAG: hypothetical protein WBM83_07270 [Flavobacteriaceae bacterium]
MGEDHMSSMRVLQTAQKEERYMQLVVQLLKDFRLANISVDFTPLISTEDLKRIVHEKVYYLIMEKFNDYLNLMYVIDIPEKSFKNAKFADVVEFSEKATYFILQRELQKVRLKESLE